MGITQQIHGTANVNAIANLALLTGNIGRESSALIRCAGRTMYREPVMPDVCRTYIRVISRSGSRISGRSSRMPGL